MKNDSCNCIVKESFINPENRNIILKQTIKKLKKKNLILM